MRFFLEDKISKFVKHRSEQKLFLRVIDSEGKEKGKC